MRLICAAVLSVCLSIVMASVVCLSLVSQSSVSRQCDVCFGRTEFWKDRRIWENEYRVWLEEGGPRYELVGEGTLYSVLCLILRS
eukprot:COSAG01_NODE_3435_length_6099_cov_11.954500_7_plen_85_part_00